MTKVLVYGETTREARAFYNAKQDESVGSRVYADYDNGEEYDVRLVVNESKIGKKKKKK